VVLQVSELVEKETKNAVLCYEVHCISLRIVFVLLRHLAEKKVQFDAHWAVLSDTCLSACQQHVGSVGES
jgi:hypothetical protein